MYLAKTPAIAKPLMNQLVWHGSRAHKKVYLTFDDGPIISLTPWVMNELQRVNAKASFFCVGDNVLKNPTLLEELINEGHSVGNHSQNHLNGWKNKDYKYIKNTLIANNLIDSELFRPPYGKIKRSQAESLKKRFSLIMWDVLSGDFDQKISPQKCLKNVIKNVSNGSIIVFHDNLKAEKNLKYALPRTLDFFLENGYEMCVLPNTKTLKSGF